MCGRSRGLVAGVRRSRSAAPVGRQPPHANPDSLAAQSAAGTPLDLTGQGGDARQHFQKAIALAANAAARANAQRANAMPWVFSGNCQETVRYE